MDGAAASASQEDGAGDKPRDGDTGNNASPPAEDTADRIFYCRVCGEDFREEAAYLEHQHQHPQESMYLDNKLDGLHDVEKDNESINVCTLCSLSFFEPSELLSHMEKSHGQPSQKEPSVQIQSGVTKHHTYECLDCGKCYGVFGHFLNHQRSHKQASKSVFHDLEHLKKKSFQCESCGRNYSRASALDAHRRCHEEKLVKSRTKSSSDTLHTQESMVEAKPSENQTVDTPEKTFTCSCGKAFTALLRLKTHQRFSRNSQCSPEEKMDKPKKSSNDFYCIECKKSFNSHIALMNHKRWHANHSNDSVKKFQCEECGKVFMTQTFYERHQRLVHSDETAAKSFLQQVCQLQKKAFECKDCGLKFSRASALHSHQLHHTDVFRETEKEAPMHTSLLPQPDTAETARKEAERDLVESEKVLSISVAEEAAHVSETDEDMEGYEPGDFNVQVISASESEDEPVQDLNPDLELLCESDQEVRDDGDAGVSTSHLVSKTEMDLKIVEIDFEQTDEPCAPVASEAEIKTTGERFDCPECCRWFSSVSSLRVHRMCHGVRKRKQQTQGQSVAVHTCDTCGHEANSYAAHCSHIQQHETQNTNGGGGDDNAAEGIAKKKMLCVECGKCFTRLSALVSHLLHHPKRKPFQCPDCMMSYLHAASLFKHMRNCAAQKKENISVKEYNPKKTLLGPKIYHCERCEKGFWSLGAFSAHKQSQTQCTDLRLRKAGSLHSVNGRQRVKVACPVCGRKFRHKGIMALHMRKHENGNHKCELCSRSFRLFSSLLRHQVVHSDQLLPPPIKSFQHQVEQLKKNTYSCPDCGKLFSRAKARQFHMKSHGYETGHSPSSPRSAVALEDLQCATCLAHFNKKTSLRAHQKRCVKRVICKTEPSENNDTLTLHTDNVAVAQESSTQIPGHTEVRNEMVNGERKKEIQTHEGNLKNSSATNLKYKCKKCERSFSVVGALNFHKRIHAKGYKSVAKAKLSLSSMLKKPEGEEPSKGLFHCSDCGRRFLSNSSLGSHKRWHTDEKRSRALLKDDLILAGHKAEDGPFYCHKCWKPFFNRRVLQRHQAFTPLCRTKTVTHDESTQSVESECNKTFEQGSLLDARSENEHRNTADLQAPKRVGVNSNGSGSTSSTVKPKAHYCPLCSMTFAQARRLRAHQWQAHSKRIQGKNKALLRIKTEPVTASSELTQRKGNRAAGVKGTPAGRGKKKIRSDPPFVKFISCLDCGKLCRSLGVLLDHKRACLDKKHETKREFQNPETMAEVSQPLSRLSEHTAKCLFKCDNCGKAFQTEEQLGAHKTKAKSRPYCCALCCSGFWTENQLQEHLAWHDEVRCRLPNEVRLRLSAAMTAGPLKPSVPSAVTSRTSAPSSTPSSDSQSQSSHKCQHCGKAFLSPSALQKHERQHCNNDLYHCSICPRTFGDIQDLIDHHQECVGDYKRPSDAPAAPQGRPMNGLTCIECGTTFCQESDLHQHYIEHACGV